MEKIKTLYYYTKGFRKGYIIGSIFLVLSVLIEVIVPRLLKICIDEISINAPLFDYSIIITISITIILLFLFRGIILYYSRILLIGSSRNIEYKLRNEIYSHILKLDEQSISQYSTGDIMSRLTNDLSLVRMMYGPGYMHLLSVILLFVFSLYSMLIKDIILTIIFISPILLLSIYLSWITKKIGNTTLIVQKILSDLSAFSSEAFHGIKVIKVFNKQNIFISNFQKICIEYLNTSLKLAKYYGMLFPLLIAISSLITIMILWIGGYYIINGYMTLGDLIEYIGYIEIMTFPLLGLGWILSVVQRGLAGYERVNSILNIKPKIKFYSASENIIKLDGSIVIKNLSFNFGEKKVLNDISISINSGEKIGIIGPIGSGKSTLINLLLKLYDVPENTIFYNNTDIIKISTDDIRKQVCIVPQDNYLFSDTIRNNILFGVTEDISDDIIIEYCRYVGLSDEIESFPDKLDTKVGERGVTLSGGQKQRLCIARAMIIKPRILILDDAFSSIDNQTTKSILTNIYNILNNITIIIITHRINNILDVDNIMYIKDGKLIETGSHNELLSIEGEYFKYYNKQNIYQELSNL